MSDTQKQIRSLIEDFAAELTTLVEAQAKESVLDAIAAAVGGTSVTRKKRVSTKPKRRTTKKRTGKKPGPKPGAKKKTRKKAARKPAAKKSGRRTKRTAAQIAKMEADLIKSIKGNGGRRMEDIAKELKTTTKDMMLPMKNLLAAGKLKAKGKTRATQYWAK